MGLWLRVPSQEMFIVNYQCLTRSTIEYLPVGGLYPKDRLSDVKSDVAAPCCRHALDGNLACSRSPTP